MPLQELLLLALPCKRPAILLQAASIRSTPTNGVGMIWDSGIFSIFSIPSPIE